MRRAARLALVLLGAILLCLSLNTGYQFLSTLDRLKVVEAERDQWQRPSDVLQALDLQPGNVLVDLGSGSGYFTLKAAEIVGRPGRVIAVDVRKLSLFFLRVRAFLLGEHNVQAIVGDQDDSHLPFGIADSVLICNTYHEFETPSVVLDHTFKALRPGGRLVIVDRELGADTQNHEIPEPSVEAELARDGFEILSRNESFINRLDVARPDVDRWWMIIARRPQGLGKG